MTTGHRMRPSPPRSPALRALPLLLLAGCWVSSDELREKIDGGDIRVESLEPAYGTTAGGTEVVLVAAPLGSEVEVRFDGELAVVEQVGDGQVVVRTPPGEDEGYVDVEIEAGDHYTFVHHGFHYFADGEGQTGALGSLVWHHYVGDYWLDDPEDRGHAWVGFTRPTDFTYADLYGTAIDTCTSEYAYDWSGVSFYDTGATELLLESATAREVLLGEDPEIPFNFYTDELVNADFELTASYALKPMEGAAPWPDLQVDGLVETPGAFSIITPPVAGTTPPDVVRNFILQWSTAVTGDYMVANLYRYEGSEVAELVRCVMRDDGSFQVPRLAWTDWESDEQLIIYLGRVEESQARLPHNGSNSAIAGVYWLVGGAFTTD